MKHGRNTADICEIYLWSVRYLCDIGKCELKDVGRQRLLGFMWYMYQMIRLQSQSIFAWHGSRAIGFRHTCVHMYGLLYLAILVHGFFSALRNIQLFTCSCNINVEHFFQWGKKILVALHVQTRLLCLITRFTCCCIRWCFALA